MFQRPSNNLSVCWSEALASGLEVSGQQIAKSLPPLDSAAHKEAFVPDARTMASPIPDIAMFTRLTYRAPVFVKPFFMHQGSMGRCAVMRFRLAARYCCRQLPRSVWDNDRQ